MIAHAKQIVIQHSEQVKHVVDGVSIGTLVATLAGLLPHLATAATFAWACIRIYETKTVQRWLRRRKKR